MDSCPVKCERCCEMKATRDNPADGICGPCPVCCKLLCYACWTATHKFKCYLCHAVNCCHIYFGRGIRPKPCCNQCR